MKKTIRLTLAGLALIVAACARPTPTATPSPAPTATLLPATHPPSTATAGGPAWTYVAFGDSWPNGAHCNGCRPFPELYADALAATTDHRINFINLTTNGGTARDLWRSMQKTATVRDAITAADIIVISTGANDLGPAYGEFAGGNCGGPDNFDCFRAVGDGWREYFDGMLTEIDALRAGQPTAVRLVTNSNEALSAGGLSDFLGKDFAAGGGAFTTNLHHDILCAVAAAHNAQCVDLRPVLNGPNFDQPQDVNTPAVMQLVADALAASGLAELR